MDGNTRGDWRQLCQAVSKEQDPEKLLDLVRQINRALEQQLTGTRYSEPSHA